MNTEEQNLNGSGRQIGCIILILYVALTSLAALALVFVFLGRVP